MGKTDLILDEVRYLRAETTAIGKKVAGIEQHLSDMNSKVQRHETQIQCALDGVDDNKVRLAKYLGASFGGGGIASVIIFVLRSLL